MQQSQGYPKPGLISQLKPFSVGNISTPNSPQNINFSYSYQQTSLNSNPEYISSNKKQIIVNKPVSVQVYSSSQSPKIINQYTSSNAVQINNNIGATQILAGAVPRTHNSQYHSTQQYQRIIDASNGVPTRPNFRFFGSGVRENIQKSTSPHVQVHQTYSREPVRLHNSSESGKKSYSRVTIQYQTPSFYQVPQQIQPPRIIRQQIPHHQQQIQTFRNYLQPIHQQIQQPIYQTNQQIGIPQRGNIQIMNFQGSNMQNSNLQGGAIQSGITQGGITQGGLTQGSIIQGGIIQGGTQVIPNYGGGQISPLHNQITQIENKTIITTTLIWQHRFVQIYQKFQIFVQRFESVAHEIYDIDEMFDHVNDQEAWNQLRARYNELIQRFNQMRQQIIIILEQNKSAINSLSPEVIRQLEQNQGEQSKEKEQEDEEGQGQEQQQQGQREIQGNQQEGGQTGKSGSENNHMWQNRCYELMQQHQQLKAEINQLRQQNERLKMQDKNENQKKPNDSSDSSKGIQMQKTINTLHTQYKKLEQNYNHLSEQYTRVVHEFQNREIPDTHNIHENVHQLQQQLNMSHAKLQELTKSLQDKTNTIIQLQKQIESYNEILEQNKILMESFNKQEHDIQMYEAELQNKQKFIMDYDEEMKNLHVQIDQLNAQLQQTRIRKDTSAGEELQKKLNQIAVLKEQQKNYITLIETHEQSIEQMSMRTKSEKAEYESTVRQKQEQIRLLKQLLDEERLSKQKMYIQNTSIEPISPTKQTHFNITESKQFQERLRIEVDEILLDKNRKIKILTQDIEQLRYQLQSLEKDKEKQIRQIKEFFTEEQQKYMKKLNDKQNNIKLLQQKNRSMDNQLTNRNMEISRFRHQSPVHSLGQSSDQSRKFNEQLDKKNRQLQLLKRTLEQKNVSVKELEQKIYGLELEINNKVFQVNSLKRQAHDLHGNRAELDNLNNALKKKNQELNQLRLNSIELEQLRMTIDTLERQKIRMNEYIKQKSRELETKDKNIQTLERKINSLTSDASIGAKKHQDGSTLNPLLGNYENLLRQREGEIKGLKYQLQTLETKIMLSQKANRDLTSKVTNYQRSGSVLKADMQNKIARYQTDIKTLNKQIKVLKDNKQQLTYMIESLQSKNTSLQRSLDERNSLYDKQLTKTKEKVSSFEQNNTNLLVDQELLKSQLDRLGRQNRELNEKIRSLEQKIQVKNTAISQIQDNYTRKQKEDLKVYQQKIKRLDDELKLSSAKLKIMQQQISTLNKKISSAQNQKKSYRNRLITEHSNQKPEFINFRYASEHHESGTFYQVNQMEKFKIRDHQSNEVFENKVIYDLKKENDLLKRELSGLGLSSFSMMNRIDTHHHQMSNQTEFYTERAQNFSKKNAEQQQLINFHKNKNKQLESRIDELLKMNSQLKIRLTNMNSASTNQLSVQFYKDQVSKLELEVAELKDKIKRMLNDHQGVRSTVQDHKDEADTLREKVNELNLKINELKNNIKNNEYTITQLENAKMLWNAQVERLNQIIQKNQREKQESYKKDRTISDQTRKIKTLQEQISKLSVKSNFQASQIQRLNEQIQNKKSQLTNKLGENSDEVKKLRKRIIQLQKQLQIIKLEQHSSSQNSTQNGYKLEKVRSYFTEIESLVGELKLTDRRDQQTKKQINQQVKQGLNVLSLIQI